MTCPHCESAATTECPHRTELGYRRFCCRTCQRRFNERTGTAYNRLQYPTDVVSLVVLWRVRYKLSLRAKLVTTSWLLRTFGEGGPKAFVVYVGESTAYCLWSATRRHPLSVRVMCASADPSRVHERPRITLAPSRLRM
jgi:hypothetical protein